MERPSRTGPYLPEYGQCAYGHDVNGYGRCEPLNRTPSHCPSAVDRSSYLLTQPVDTVVMIAEALEISIPPLLTGDNLRAALVPLIVVAEGLT